MLRCDPSMGRWKRKDWKRETYFLGRPSKTQETYGLAKKRGECSPMQATQIRPDAARADDSSCCMADETAIDLLLRDLYEVISFVEGGEPDWQRMATLFSPHARITRITPEATDYYDLHGFQEMAKELLELGTFTSFHEREVVRSQRIFGGFAHVLSAYETKQSEGAREPFARGVNSIQLIRESDGWRVLSLLWDEEGPDMPLVLEHLFHQEGKP